MSSDVFTFIIAVQFAVILIFGAIILLQSFGMRQMLDQKVLFQVLSAATGAVRGVADLTETPRDNEILDRFDSLVKLLKPAPADPAIEPSTETIAKVSKEAILTADFPANSEAPHGA